MLGYEIGRAVGPALYEREGRFLKKKYFETTRVFFDQHGNKALVIGRFVPFVRTYITVVAGVTRMRRRRFFLWSLVGAVMWVLSITLLGYFLGRSFPSLGENIDKAILVILAFSVIPVAYEWRKHRRRHRTSTSEPAPKESVSRVGSPGPACVVRCVPRKAAERWTTGRNASDANAARGVPGRRWW